MRLCRYEGCVAVVSYLLTFQSMAGRTWCSLISLNCCRSDVSHATGGLADGYKVICTGCGLGMFRCRQLAQLPVAGIPSKPRYFGDGRVARSWKPGALYGMLEWCCADGLSA